MDNKDKTVNTIQPAVADTAQDDVEAKIAALEAEKNKLIEENSNWKVAALKYKKKAKAQADYEDNEEEDGETDEERMRRIAGEALAQSRLMEIAQEQDSLIKKALKENKELRASQAAKNTKPTSIGSHSEGEPVKDTTVTPEQHDAFKARGWTDKDIERYKKNLRRYAV